ncbi:MAG: Gfo/Idh/MocA family oxidoreductase [Actinomycetota bacterium]
MTRVGIFGVAHVHTDAYAGNLAVAAGAVLVGISEVDDELRGAWQDRHDGRSFSSHRALIAEGIDAAIICTPTNEHRSVVEMLAAAGIDVLCEKPLATNLEDARAIVDVCANAGVLLMTAFPMRFSTVLASTREQIAEGRIGDVISYLGTNQGHIPTDYAEWFADPVAAGGGAVMDHTVHLADILRWWTGAEPIEVFAETNQIMHPDISVETGGVVTVGFDNGTFATIDCSWSRPDEWPTWGGLTIEAVGTSGVLTVDAFADRLDVWSKGDNTWIDWGADANQAMIDHFIGAVNGDHALAVTGIDGLRATEVALAAYRSAAAGQPVEV